MAKRYAFRELLDKLLAEGRGYDEILEILQPQLDEIWDRRMARRREIGRRRTAQQNSDTHLQRAKALIRAAGAKRDRATGRFLPNNRA
jgi:hypothetical protein